MFRLFTKCHLIKSCVCKPVLSHSFKDSQKNLIKRLSTTNSPLDISGIYPPIITNFDNDGIIDFGKFMLNVEKWKLIPFKGYVVLGSTGEFVSLNEDEKVKLVKCIKDASSVDKLVIAGSGCELSILRKEVG